MRDSRKKACVLMLAAAGLLPHQLSASSSSHHTRVKEALAESKRLLKLEEFLLKRVEAVGTPGISPTYNEELETTKQRVFEAKALVIALKRLEKQLAPSVSPPSTSRAKSPAPGTALSPEAKLPGSKLRRSPSKALLSPKIDPNAILQTQEDRDWAESGSE